MLTTAPYAPILINSSSVPDTFCLSQITTGRAEVLDKLIPKLSLAYSPKTTHYLQQVDDYMLFETRQLLQRLVGCFEQLTLNDGEFEFNFLHNKIAIKNSVDELQELTELANKDPWCIGALAWLQPNYLALLHSIELRQFAAHYQRNRTQALAHYKHFDLPDNGLSCKLSYHCGGLKMYWRSPLQHFYLPEFE